MPAVALQAEDRLPLHDVEQVQAQHRAAHAVEDRERRRGEVGQTQREVVLRVARLQQRAREHVHHRLRGAVRSAPEDAADRVQVLLGHAQLDHPAQHLEVLELIVVVDRLVVAREREAERAVVDVCVGVADAGRAGGVGEAVAAVASEQALDRQQLQPARVVRGAELLERAPVGMQPLEQRESRRSLGLGQTFEQLGKVLGHRPDAIVRAARVRPRKESLMTAPSAIALPRRDVLADVLPGARVRDAVLVLSGALLTALFAQISIEVPGSPVPITGQTLAVGLVGATLGARRGASSLGLYALLGLFLPFYADGESGWDVIWGASGGYIVGFIVAAGVIGWLAERGADRRVVLAFLAFVAGQLIVFAFGLAGLKISVGETWEWTLHNGFVVFIFGGVVKAVIGAIALPSAWHLVRRFEKR